MSGFKPAAIGRKVRSRRNMLLTLLSVTLIAYAGWLLLLFLVQDVLLFPRHVLGARTLPEAPVGFTEWSIRSEEGPVHAWFLPGTGCDQQTACGTVVMLHGNGMVIDGWISEASWFAEQGWNVLLPEFRGYGRASGSPSESKLRKDTVEFIDRLSDEPGVDPDRLILYGRSIGGALAAQVALDRTPAGMILQTPPSSIGEMAWRYGAPSFLVRNRFDTIAALKAVGPVPTLLLEHDSDEVIPSSQSARIRQAAPHARHVLLRGDHNALADPEEDGRFLEVIGAFLDECPAGTTDDR